MGNDSISWLYMRKESERSDYSMPSSAARSVENSVDVLRCFDGVIVGDEDILGVLKSLSLRLSELHHARGAQKQ